MGKAVASQHPAVVLRSHYQLVRALLAVAMIAVLGLTVAVVILADDDGASTTSLTRSVPTAPAADNAPPVGQASYQPRLAAPARIHGGTPVPDVNLSGRDARVSPGTRYDGGPEEGTRGLHTEAAAPSTRYDGGPDEGTRGPGH